MSTKFLSFAKPVLMICLSVALFSSCKKDETEPVNPEPEYPKEILVAPMPELAFRNTAGELFKLNYNGDSLYRQFTTSAVINFKRWIINRKIRYSYVQYEESQTIKDAGYLPGAVIVTDENMNEINRIHLLPYGKRTTADPNAVDGHDFILIDDNHYIVIAYYQKVVYNIPSSLRPAPECKVIVAIIQEVKDGNVVWEWDSSDYPEFYTTSADGNVFSNGQINHDYMHINSIFIDPNDNNLICSFRNLDQVVKLNRNNGKIIWKLGGKNGDFPMSSEKVFLRQHHATITNDGHTLLLFDNGEQSMRAYSRILEFQLDEVAKKITSFKSTTLPGGTFCGFMGSVQKTDSTYFVCGGSIPYIWEIDVKTGLMKWSRELSKNSYRAYKY
jgi:arylsulfate sulfotransferase